MEVMGLLSRAGFTKVALISGPPLSKSKNNVMQKSLKISFITHFVILIISSITLPFLMGRVQAPLVMSVDLVQIGERTNIPYAPKVSDGAKLIKNKRQSCNRTSAT